MKRAYRVNFTKPHNIAVGIFIESRAGAATVIRAESDVSINIIRIEYNVTAGAYQMAKAGTRKMNFRRACRRDIRSERPAQIIYLPRTELYGSNDTRCRSG